MKNIYDNSVPKIKRAPRSLDEMQFEPRLGRVLKLRDRMRVDIVLQSGEIFENVRIPGPALLAKGQFAHGTTNPIQKDQLVLVGFSFGSARSPIIISAYSHSGVEEDLENIRDFWNTYSLKFNMETDIVNFHQSGYFVRQTTNKIEIYDITKQLVGEMDFLTKKLSWTLGLIDIESDVNIKGNLTLLGDISTVGKISATQKISSDEDLEAGGIGFLPHTHLYNPGPSPPVPSSPPS